MDKEQAVERLARRNFHYFLGKLRDLCNEATLEGIYLAGIVAYYDPVNQTTAWICKSTGDKCSLAHIMGEAAAEIASPTEEETE